jgi:hypothetical protein
MKIPNKVARYGLEFLTVFLGVSVSLIAENWRQRRADTHAEHNSLVRLYSDLRAEQQDVEGNLTRARTGLSSARWLIANGARGHSADTVSAALTAVGTCSFFLPQTSEYTALKSSGRLSIIEEQTIRESVVSFYEMDPFIAWLHERDCVQTGDLMDSLLGLVELVEPDTGQIRGPRTGRGGRSGLDSLTQAQRDSLRQRRDSLRRLAGDTMGLPPDSVRARVANDFMRAAGDTTRGQGAPGNFGRANDRRYPRVVFHAGQEGVLDDPVLRGRLVRLATQRRYLGDQLETRLAEVKNLRGQIKVRLGSDTLAVQGGNGNGRNGGGNAGTRAGQRR